MMMTEIPMHSKNTRVKRPSNPMNNGFKRLSSFKIPSNLMNSHVKESAGVSGAKEKE